MGLTATALIQNELNRYESVRRKSAQSAYSEQVGLKDSTESLVKRLEALLLGELSDVEAEETIALQREVTERTKEAASLPDLRLPAVREATLEETIDAWERDETVETDESFEWSTDSFIDLHNRARAIVAQPVIARLTYDPYIPYETLAHTTYATHQQLLHLPYEPNVSRFA